jgi:hypothetical protein
MNDFFAFRRMITPLIIQILFWVGLGGCALTALVMIVGGLSSNGGGATVLLGLVLLAAGPFVVRIYCELLILAFRMNETLTDIRGALLRARSASGNE